MSNLKSINASLLEVLISSKNECIFIRDLSDLTLQIILNTWWASMNRASKRTIAWNNSRHASSWRFDLHWGIDGTCSTGTICIICHQVLRHLSEHGTSSMGKYLLAKAHITTLNELTESEVTKLTSSPVTETALAILKKQGSWGITIVSLQRKFLFHILHNPYWLKWPTKRSKLAAKDLETSKVHQDMWNRYLMLGFVSSHISRNAISNFELQRSYQESHSKLVVPSATSLSNICQRNYAVTMDATEKQLPSRNKVTLPLDRWTSTNKVATMLVIAYSIDRNWAFCEVQLAFNVVDHLFFSLFES